MGEASKKLSSSEAWTPPHAGIVDNSNVVRFEKAKWSKNGRPCERNTNCSRLTSLKKGGEGRGARGVVQN